MNAENNTVNITMCFYFHDLWKTVGIPKKIVELYNEGVEKSGQMFEPEVVKVSSTGLGTKEEIITHLNQKAGHIRKVKNVKSCVDVVLDRKSAASTVVGFGIAIPHGESDAITETFVVCLYLLHPVQWGHDEVDLVFMIGIPLSSRSKEYLRILAMLGRHLMKETFRKELRKMGTDQEFYGCTEFLKYEN